MIKKAIVVLLMSFASGSAIQASAQTEVTAPIRQFIDAFNRGDTKAAFATYAADSILIVDEFAPHRWIGTQAPQQWIADYDKHAKETGVTNGRVTYSKPTRTEIEGDLAYVIMPTVYLYNERGKPLVEEGQITVVLRKEKAGWKMSSWVWSGVKPHPPTSSK